MTVSFEHLFRGPTPGFGQEPAASEPGRLDFLRSREEWITLALLVIALAAVVSSVEDANWVGRCPRSRWPASAGWRRGGSPRSCRRGRLGRARSPRLGTLFVTALLLHTLRLSDPEGPTGLIIRWSEMKLRIARWVEVLIDGGISNDSLPFVAMLVALVWLIAFLAAWATVRWQNAWVALLPLGVLLLTNIAYLPGNPPSLHRLPLRRRPADRAAARGASCHGLGHERHGST